MRMVDFPLGLTPKAIRPLSGPDIVGATSSERHKSQVVVNPFGGLATLEATYPPMNGAKARAFSTLSAAAHSGANCFRFPFFDPDEPSWKELESSVYGTSGTTTWSTGLNWSNGQPWQIGKPIVPVTEASAKNSGTITLNTTAWNGHVPAWFGIIGHFAVYRTMGYFSRPAGTVVRVWPPVRRAITTSDYATMRPTVAMQVVGQEGAPWTRNVGVMDEARLVMAEVLDETVRAYVTEDYP